VFGLQKAAGAHYVDRASFPIVGTALLSQQTHPFVMIDTEGIAVLTLLPEKIVKGRDSQRSIGILGQ
jgi:hypothetical protein